MAWTGFPRTCFWAVKLAPHISRGPPVFLKIKFNVSKSTECFGSGGAWRALMGLFRLLGVMLLSAVYLD